MDGKQFARCGEPRSVEEQPYDDCRFCRMDQDQLYDEATEVTAEKGAVVLDGPDGVDVRVTPEAAEQTADNLLLGAVKARGQRRLAGLPHQPR